MTDTDRTIVKNADMGPRGALPLAGTAADITAKENQRVYTVRFIPDVVYDSSAGSAVAKTHKVHNTDRKVRVVSARVFADATIASNTSLGATITLVADNDSSASTNTSTNVTTAAGITTGNSSTAVALVAGVSLALPLSATASALVLAAGDSLYVKQAKVGVGVSMGNWGVTYVLEEI